MTAIEPGSSGGVTLDSQIQQQWDPAWAATWAVTHNWPRGLTDPAPYNVATNTQANGWSVTPNFGTTPPTATVSVPAGVDTSGEYSVFALGSSSSQMGNGSFDVGPAVTSVNGETGAVVLTATDVGALATANNLSDVANVTTARTNLGLGTAATHDVPASGNAGTSQVVLGSDTRLTAAVTSVNGHTGAVTLGASDVGAVPTSQVGAANGVASLDASGKVPSSELPSGSVTSVNGQTGVVNLTAANVGALATANNLSDVANAATVRTNLAVLAVANNLSDVANPGTARTNLGLGTAATHDVPASGNASSTQVVLGSDTRFTSGWMGVSGTWTYASADGPIFVATVPNDATTQYSPGMRVMLTQSNTVKYFIIVAVTSTSLTLYGGTDYALANSTISAISFASVRAPFGFPLSPLKWQVEVKDTSGPTQTYPAANTWYTTGVTISLPIGIWDVYYQGTLQIFQNSTIGAMTGQLTLSTANNSESDSALTTGLLDYAAANSSTYFVFASTLFARKTEAISSKTTYYLNYRTTVSSMSEIFVLGAFCPTIIRAVCAYL